MIEFNSTSNKQWQDYNYSTNCTRYSRVLLILSVLVINIIIIARVTILIVYYHLMIKFSVI